MTREEMIEKLQKFCNNVRGCAVCPIDSTLCDVSSFAEMSDDQLTQCVEALTNWSEKVTNDAQKAADGLHEAIQDYWRKDAIEKLREFCDRAETCGTCPLDDLAGMCDFDILSDEQLAKGLELIGETVILETSPLQVKHGAMIEDVCARIAKSEAADNVNHPRHYELPGGLECFDVILATQGLEAGRGFCLGNAMKYLFRHQRKNGLEDVKKAVWYLNKYIDLMNIKEATSL